MNSFSVTSLKSCWGWSSSRLAGVVGKVKMVLTLDTSAWFPLPPSTQGDAVLADLCWCIKIGLTSLAQISHRGISVT